MWGFLQDKVFIRGGGSFSSLFPHPEISLKRPALPPSLPITSRPAPIPPSQKMASGSGSKDPPPCHSSKQCPSPPSHLTVLCTEDGKLQMRRQRGRPVVRILGSGWAAHSCIKVRGEEGGKHTPA